jgi:uncharacterized protein GlcG (DUF336 family)
MARTAAALIALGFLGMAGVHTHAQGVVMQRNLSLALARTMAVVDRSGQPLVLLRDEQAGGHTLEMSRRKAYTARMFRTSTLEFQKRTEDPAYTAQREVTDMLALGGGVPILVGNEAIGGVGSSGSSQTQDDACAKAGIAKVADQLK